MTAEDIVEKKEPKRLPVWACIPLFIGIFLIFMGLYGTLARGFLSMVLGVEARHPGLVGYILLESSMLLAVLTAAAIMLRFEHAVPCDKRCYNRSVYGPCVLLCRQIYS